MLPWHDEISIPTDNAPSFSHIDAAQFNALSQSLRAETQKHRAKLGVPALSVAVSVGDTFTWLGGAGWADLKAKAPVTASTQFRIGSTSKALTSVSLARAVQNNALQLDTPLKEIFTRLPNPAWAEITPRHLASHSSGLPHYRDNSDLIGYYHSAALQQHYNNVEESLEMFDDSELLFAPGEQFFYSTYGTVLLSAAIQKAVKSSYQNWTKSQVLTPLNMTATQPEPQDQMKDTATFYWRNKYTPHLTQQYRDVNLSHRLAGGGWLSTPHDLIKLAHGMFDEGFLNEKLRKQFFTPQTLNNNKVNKQKYAIGWRVHDFNLGNEFTATSYVHHGGVSRGSQSFLMYVPEYKLAIAANINTNIKPFHDFSNVTRALSKIVIRNLEENKGLLTSN